MTGRSQVHEHVLQIEVRFHEGRYHGQPEWPPAPARLFQAWVAGRGPRLSEEEAAALRWLEGLPPPTIGAPRATRGAQVRVYVPNNDLDSEGGDPAKVAGLRAAKDVHPYLFDAEVPLLYAWSFAGPDPRADVLAAVSAEVYQLGRGVDPAWALARVTTGEAFAATFAQYPGQVFRPSPGSRVGGVLLTCPTTGSFDSLVVRHAQMGERFTRDARMWVFAQPPKARFVPVGYGAPPVTRLFELRPPERTLDGFAAWPLAEASPRLVEVRDAAAERLGAALGRREDVERALIGRTDGPPVDKALRVRLIPLPSIGHPDVDPRIRRLLVEVPTGGLLTPDDVFWAFSGLVVGDAVVVPAEDGRMAERYRRPARVWRTVTPAALPEGRRRIEPRRVDEDRKGAQERLAEEARARASVLAALRHVEVRAEVAAVAVQREPWAGRGARAEAFAPGTRFAKERLWHVEVRFAEEVVGPLALGDGRYLGLGVLAPVDGSDPTSIRAFAVVDGWQEGAGAEGVARALRRAVMARVQRVLGPRGTLPTWVTGHGDDGEPAADVPHLAFACDPVRRRVLVVVPDGVDGRLLDEGLDGMRELRAGRAGVLHLAPVVLDPSTDPLLGASRVWSSVTPYLVTRHAKRVTAAEAFVDDVRAECVRRKLPVPEVREVTTRGVPGEGLAGTATLVFPRPIPGPLLLGRSRFLGGGLFARREG